MIDMISNYEKAKISMARVFLQYDQAAMIHKYSLEWLEIFPRTADFLRIPLTFLTEKPLNYVMPV